MIILSAIILGLIVAKRLRTQYLLLLLLFPNVPSIHGRTLEHTPNPSIVIIKYLIGLHLPITLIKMYFCTGHISNVVFIDFVLVRPC